MWTFYLEILLFLKFVTPTVIPDYRKLTERTDTSEGNVEENSLRLTRKKRDAYFDNILNEPVPTEDTRIWNREVCEKITAYYNPLYVKGAITSTSGAPEPGMAPCDDGKGKFKGQYQCLGKYVVSRNNM